ncbi:hypothetical protein ACHQM5_009428 [Ranunculus cassubicifolius]
MESWDPNTKSTLTQIPLLSTKAGPRDGSLWTQRLKEEYKSLISYTGMNKSKDNDWFRISAANPEGTRWTGKCWYVHNLLKYEFDLQFDIPVTYPATAPEIELPELDGKPHKKCWSDGPPDLLGLVQYLEHELGIQTPLLVDGFQP